MKNKGALIAFSVSVFLISISFIGADEKGVIQVNVLDSSECILNFVEGWNFFSFCQNLQDPDLEDVFSAISGDYRYIMKWSQQNQEFEIYSPRSAEKPFAAVNDNESYFIYMNKPATIKITGTPALSESRDLIEGWNAPSYQYFKLMPIETMTSTISSDFRYIMKWSQQNQEFEIYSPRSAEKPFTDINPTEGQFIYMNKPNTLVYPAP